jgi:hypothetical protein
MCTIEVETYRDFVLGILLHNSLSFIQVSISPSALMPSQSLVKFVVRIRLLCLSLSLSSSSLLHHHHHLSSSSHTPPVPPFPLFSVLNYPIRRHCWISHYRHVFRNHCTWSWTHEDEKIQDSSNHL